MVPVDLHLHAGRRTSVLESESNACGGWSNVAGEHSNLCGIVTTGDYFWETGAAKEGKRRGSRVVLGIELWISTV